MYNQPLIIPEEVSQASSYTHQVLSSLIIAGNSVSLNESIVGGTFPILIINNTHICMAVAEQPTTTQTSNYVMVHGRTAQMDVLYNIVLAGRNTSSQQEYCLGGFFPIIRKHHTNNPMTIVYVSGVCVMRLCMYVVHQ